MYYCYCIKWIEYQKIEQRERSYLFVHGFLYTGPTFKFCPFCGSELENDDPSAGGFENENS